MRTGRRKPARCVLCAAAQTGRPVPVHARRGPFSGSPMTTASPPDFFIGQISVRGRAILAPMDGFSDWPFRSLCRQLGSALSYTEFVNAREVLHEGKYARDKLRYSEDERPVVFQLYGDDPDEIVRAALKVRALEPDAIDINMGCPAKSIANRGAGVGLMRTPLKVARIFRRLSRALDIPVTGKIRLGWEDCKTYRLIARIVEENGGQALAVHARTKEQGYGGQADWAAIAEIRQVISIPLIGNGDVRRPADVERMRAETGCQAVMIGRAAIGNPWIFAGQPREAVSLAQLEALVREHLRRSLEFYGPELGLVLFRKHAVQYIRPLAPSRAARARLLRAKTESEFWQEFERLLAAAGKPTC